MWVKVAYFGRSDEASVRELRVDTVRFVAHHHCGELIVVYLVGSEAAIHDYPRFQGMSLFVGESARTVQMREKMRNKSSPKNQA